MSKRIDVDIKQYCPFLKQDDTEKYPGNTFTVSVERKVGVCAELSCVVGSNDDSKYTPKGKKILHIKNIIFDKKEYGFPKVIVDESTNIINPNTNVRGIMRMTIACNGCHLLPEGFKTTTIR